MSANSPGSGASRTSRSGKHVRNPYHFVWRITGENTRKESDDPWAQKKEGGAEGQQHDHDSPQEARPAGQQGQGARPAQPGHFKRPDQIRSPSQPSGPPGRKMLQRAASLPRTLRLRRSQPRHTGSPPQSDAYLDVASGGAAGRQERKGGQGSHGQGEGAGGHHVCRLLSPRTAEGRGECRKAARCRACVRLCAYVSVCVVHMCVVCVCSVCVCACVSVCCMRV